MMTNNKSQNNIVINSKKIKEAQQMHKKEKNKTIEFVLSKIKRKRKLHNEIEKTIVLAKLLNYRMYGKVLNYADYVDFYSFNFYNNDDIPNIYEIQVLYRANKFYTMRFIFNGQNVLECENKDKPHLYIEKINKILIK